MVLQQGLWYHILVLTVVLGSIWRAIITTLEVADPQARCRHIWTHSLAPGIDLDGYFDLLAPLVYAMMPPTTPPRRELLEPSPSPDGKLQTWMPKAESRIEHCNWWWYIGEVPHLLSFALATWVTFRMCPS